MYTNQKTMINDKILIVQREKYLYVVFNSNTYNYQLLARHNKKVKLQRIVVSPSLNEVTLLLVTYYFYECRYERQFSCAIKIEKPISNACSYNFGL